MEQAQNLYNNAPTNGNTPSNQQRESSSTSPAIPVKSTISNTATPTSAIDQGSNPPSPRLSPEQHVFNQRDLELIHYYSTQTYMTLTSNLQAHLVWRDVIFQQGLKHKFLLHALMATAALHKATNHAEDSSIHKLYINIALEYQSTALADYIPLLSTPNQDNAVALFILSALLAIWLFGSRRLPEAFDSVKLKGQKHLALPTVGPKTRPESIDFMEVLGRVQGMSTIVKQTFHWILGQGIDPLLTPPPDSDLPRNPPDIEASFSKIQYRIDTIREKQPHLPESVVQERMGLYNERLSSLRQVARTRTVIQHDQQVFAWPVTFEPGFIEVLRQRDPIAVALFVHWAACFKCLDHQWWARGWSGQLVKDSAATLDDSWADVLSWPRKEVGLE